MLERTMNAYPSTSIPPPSLNGGLYTGEPFATNAPWRNFPATPDAGYMVHVNLLAGGNLPPGEATYHLPGGGLRPGNNTPMMPMDMAGGRRVPGLNMVCVPDASKRRVASNDNHGFSGFQYLDFTSSG
jgi:hypothetical protein